MKLLERLPRESGGEYALRTIKENIISLELAPGCQISENELAAEMGLSRTPVREALMELAYDIQANAEDWGCDLLDKLPQEVLDQFQW